MSDDLSPQPSVSVVIPTYQRRALVTRAVSSVRAQTFRDYELIVIDDGSTDGTEQVLAALGAGIRYHWQENRGLSAARNAGAALARGAIVAFLDSDDRWLPQHLAVVMEVLSRHPEAVLCSTSPRFEIGGRQVPAEAEVVDALPSLFAENIVGHPSSIAVRRDALLTARGFDEHLRVMEGWELWLRLALLGRFALLRHRTIADHATRGSLTQESSRNGEYLRSLNRMPERVAAVAAGVDERPDGTRLRARAVGLGAYLAALRAVTRDDDATARTQLAVACAALPELSREPQPVANRLALLKFGPAGRLQSFTAAHQDIPKKGVRNCVMLVIMAGSPARHWARAAWCNVCRTRPGWWQDAARGPSCVRRPLANHLGRRAAPAGGVCGLRAGGVRPPDHPG